MSRKKCRIPHPSDFTTDDTSQLDDDRRHRPPMADHGSFSGEETPMIVLNRIQDPLVRLAMVAERYMDFLEREAQANEPENVQHEERMLTPLEASRILRIHVQTVTEWCRQGKIDAIKIGGTKENGKGGKWLVPREELDRHLRRHELINGKALGGGR